MNLRRFRFLSRRVWLVSVRTAFFVLPWLAFSAALVGTVVAACDIIPLETISTGPNKPDYDKDKEDIKRYLEWVIAVAGIFALAQTLAAGFAAQSFTQQAKRDLKEIEEWKKKYANLSDLDDKQSRALEGLREAYRRLKGDAPAKAGAQAAELVDWLDWRRKLYGSMEVLKRQELLSIDRYLGFDLKLNRFQNTIEQANIIRMLANFYVSKYEHEEELKSSHWDDMERAEYLLRLWILQHPDQFQFRNDLGLVLIKYMKLHKQLGNAAKSVEFRNNARTEFEVSRDLRARQQRAYFNLAVIEYGQEEKPANSTDPKVVDSYKNCLNRAIKQATTALKHSHWETKPDALMKTEIEYNLACYQALLAYFEANGKTLAGGAPAPIPANSVNEVVKLLEEVKKTGTIIKKYVDGDFKLPDGDIALFRSLLIPADQTRLDALRSDLSNHAAPE
jgi:hypothetical protein